MKKAIRFLPIIVILTIFLFFSVSAVAALDQEQIDKIFKTWDKNKDGKLEKAEWKGKMEFSKVDRNGNGYITKDELSPPEKTGGRETSSVSDDDKCAKLIKAWDKDKSGVLTKDEWKGKADFSRVDTNGDGKLTEAECNSLLKGGDDDSPVREVLDTDTCGKLFKAWDKNKDNVLTDKEWKGKAEFSEVDKNGDGKLTEAECNSLLKPGDDDSPAREVLDTDIWGKLIKGWDKDKSGTLSEAEYKGKAPFSRFDGNSDGEITKDEFDKVMKGQRTCELPEVGNFPSDEFLGMDKNKNCALEKSEYKGDKKFNKVDENGNGKITFDEYVKGVSGPELMDELTKYYKIKTAFDRMDTKSPKGKLTKQEYQGKIPFNTVDDNKDNYIEFPEMYREYSSAMDLSSGQDTPGLTENQIRTLFDLLDSETPRGVLTQNEYMLQIPFNTIDKDDNNRISYEEFNAAFKLAQTVKYENLLKTIFDAWDESQPSGVLTNDEYKGNIAFNRVDNNNDGRLTYDEFAKAYGGIGVPTPPEDFGETTGKLSGKQIDVLFRLLDWKEDSENYLTRREYIGGINFGSIDENNNGEIDKDEFFDALKDYRKMSYRSYLALIFGEWDTHWDSGENSDVLQKDEYHGYLSFVEVAKNTREMEESDFIKAYKKEAE